METSIKIHSNTKNLFYVLATLTLGSSFNPVLKAEQIANSSVDLKKDIENIKQENFKKKDNLESPIKDSLNNEGEIRKTVSERTILLKEISISGNNKFSEKKLKKFFINLIGKDVTFSDLSNAALEMQSLYREKGYICLLYTSPSPRDATLSRMPSSA